MEVIILSVSRKSCGKHLRLKNILSLPLRLLYPPKCAFCRKPIEINSDEQICTDCRLHLRYCSGRLCCKKCGKPFPSLGEKGLCPDCLHKHSTAYKRITSVLEYDTAVRRSISAYKGTSPQRQLAYTYARFMKLQTDLEYDGIEFDFIIGVPPSKHRMSKKNFDHIGFLCRALSKETGIPHLRRCLKQTETIHKQSTLSYNERQKNIIGSIGIRRGMNVKLKDKVCLLADDICTTGATIDECARTLKKAGAKAVYAVTLATVTKTRKN